MCRYLESLVQNFGEGGEHNMPSKSWREHPSAARRYGDGCRCHEPNSGHSWDEGLVCRGCGCSWFDNQEFPMRCENPLNYLQRSVPFGKRRKVVGE
jgi:hypothetical protein